MTKGPILRLGIRTSLVIRSFVIGHFPPDSKLS